MELKEILIIIGVLFQGVGFYFLLCHKQVSNVELSGFWRREFCIDS